MNTLKETFKSVYLPVHFFYSMTLSPDIQKIVKEKKLNVKLLSLILHMKQMMTKTLKLKLLIVFPCLLMNFMIFHKILLKIWLVNMLSISLTDEEINYIEYSTRGQQSSNLWWEYRKVKLTASNF